MRLCVCVCVCVLRSEGIVTLRETDGRKVELVGFRMGVCVCVCVWGGGGGERKRGL